MRGERLKDSASTLVPLYVVLEISHHFVLRPNRNASRGLGNNFPAISSLALLIGLEGDPPQSGLYPDYTIPFRRERKRS